MDGITIVLNLTDCNIPASTMTYPNKYKLKVTAKNPNDASQTTVEWSEIQSKKANLTVHIHGGDRSISVDVINNLYSTVYPLSSNVVYRWS